MFTWTFWKDALERAIKTGAQVLIVSGGLNAISLDGDYWTEVGLTVLGTVVLSLLTSIVSSRVGSDQDASLVK